ncbi:uncharacterized protein LOC116249598 [Nymphaea colorata]|nr:uncharacterized protein LOC116249598 [Nymphaea colorata]XP_031478598.1 uncharacterized protein LOC116249598 [Nymphaea colorata]XP_031478601.1 uncharacterized protein LOC116249598 [Nymphaea colorata]XP_031478602.1 uncharacterized protein LOC116249598 [Nymphaea colorata]XP_031478603.1 uncharacterized protein LOC116249598 [Nymphaea colorata]XP_031478604.1 uncharacterized protein LOC116249598 [Nymphaea colorata]XP_031478606.1 uncharacterized protein LOC116249598 [Nymphaea colorata]
MGRLLKQYEKEHLKSTMLKHEETFKEQICELHRLYRVQKLLMNDVKNNRSSSTTTFGIQRQPSSQATIHQAQGSLRMQKMIDLEHPAEEPAIECMEDAAVGCEIEHETDIELTLSTGCNKKKKKKDQPSYCNASAPFPSASIKSDAGHVPVTGSNLRLWERLTGPSWESFQDEQKRTYNDEELSRQKGQPLWLFPVLSLNVT